MKFNRDLLDKFLNGKYAMALRTQEEWNQFMELLESETNAVWRNDRKPTYRDYWYLNTYETSVRAYSEMNRLSYCDVDYYISKGFQIIEFSDLIKQDLRDLLQVGYKVGYRKCNEHGSLKQISNEEYLDLIKSYTDQNLIDVEDDVFTINTIYRPKYNGVKPMEWVLSWERKEELFTLELPNTSVGNRFLLSNIKNNNYEFNHISINPKHVIKKTRNNTYRIRFTQQEIDNLPNQELIKALVKKEVKGK